MSSSQPLFLKNHYIIVNVVNFVCNSRAYFAGGPGPFALTF